MVLILSAISFLLQVIAVVMAVRMLKSVKYHPAFILMATVTGLIAVRRLIAINDVILTQGVHKIHLLEDAVAIAISVLFVAGFWRLSRHMQALADAERRLAGSEAELRATVDQVGDGILIRQADGKILAASTRLCALTGYDAEQLVGQKISSLIYPGAPDRWTHQPTLQFAGDDTRVEQAVTHRDNRLLVLEIHSRRRSDGHIDDFVRDITVQHETAQKLLAVQTELAELAAVAEVIPVQISPQLRWLTVPDQLLRLIGYTRDQLHNRPTREITPADDANVEWRLTERLTDSTHEQIEFRKRINAHNGNIVHFRVVRRAVRDGQGGLQHFLDAMHPVSAADFQKLNDSSTIGARAESIGELDGTQNQRHDPERSVASLHAETIASNAEGYERIKIAAELISDTIYDLDLRTERAWISIPSQFRVHFPDLGDEISVSQWLNLVHEDDRKRVDETQLEAVRSGDQLDVEYRLVAPSGVIFWVRDSGRVIRDMAGQPIRLVGVLRDLSDAHKTNEDLILNDARFRLALQSSATLVFTADRELRYTWVFNATETAPESVIGKTDYDLFDHDDAARMIAVKRRVIETGEGTRVDMEINYHGRRTHFIGQVEPLRDAGGEIVGVVSSITDVSELKLAQVEATKSQVRLKILSDIAARILNNESVQSIVHRTVNDLSGEFPDARLVHLSLDRAGVLIDCRPLDEMLAKLVRDRATLPLFGPAEHMPPVGRFMEWIAPDNPASVTDLSVNTWIQAGVHMFMAVPIHKTEDRMDVLCAVFRSKYTVTEHDRSLLTKTAEQLSVAIRFAREQDHRRSAEAASQDSEERFRVAADAGIDGFVMLQAVTDIAGEIVDFRVSSHNQVAEAVFRGICIIGKGKTLTEILGHRRGRDFIGVYRQVFETGRPFESEFQSELAHTPTWFHQQVVPAKEGVAVWVRNVTERVLSEQEMRRLSAAIEQSANMVCITDTRGVIEYVNAQFCSITGYSAAEIVGRSSRILRAPEAEHLHAEIADTLAARNRWVGKTRSRRKDGTLYWEQTTIAPITSDAGETTSYVAVSSDITEELHQQEVMQESDKLAAVGMLAAGVSHEFKNYLGGIIGNATFALDELATNQDIDLARRTLEDIVSMGERANEVAMSLLSYSKTRPERFAPEDLAAIVKTTITLIAKELRNRSIELYTHFDDVQPLRLSAGKIQQLLLNLLINAEQAIGSKGIITVSVMRFDDSIQLRVSDNGQGIPDSNLARIFDPFFSTKGVWGKDSVVGTGMGLAICRNIANEHGGELTVESAVGVGTTFTLTLPAGLIAGTTQSLTANRADGTTPEKILIFSLDKDLFAEYFPRACELGVSLCLKDDFAAIRDGLPQLNGLVICDAEFIGKIELTRVVEQCQEHRVPYVLVRCGGMDYQIEHLYAAAAATFRDLPPLEEILMVLKSPSPTPA